MLDIAVFKAEVRAILLSLGKVASEHQFRSAYYELYGESFNEKLRLLNLNLVSFLNLIPDVCRYFVDYNGEIVIHRVSSEETRHMDHLTIARKKKRGPAALALPRRRPAPVRAYQPMNRHPSQLNVRAISFRPVASRNSATASHPSTFRSFPAPLQVFRTFPASSQASRPSSNPPQANPDYKPPSVSRSTFNRSSVPSVARPAVHSANRVVYNQQGAVTTNRDEVIRTTTTPAASVTAPKTITRTVINQSVCNGNSASIKIPSTTTPKPGLNSAERIVYNQSKVVIYKGDETIVKENGDPEWTDTCSVTSSNESMPSKNDAQIQEVRQSKSQIIQTNKLDEVVVIEDDEPTAKENVEEVRNPSPQLKSVRKTPQEIRALITSKTRLFGMAIENIVHQRQTAKHVEKASDFLSDFITITDISIPPPKMETSPFFAIQLIDVASPSKFTFQFGFKDLEELSMKMRMFYEKLDGLEDYQVRELSKDLVVAVKHGSKFFRAKILRQQVDEFVVVQPVDCMTLKSKKVRIENVFYLHKSFASISQKSAIGCIHGIKPIGEEWSEESIKEFKNQKTLKIHATLKKIEEDSYQLSIVNFASKKSLTTLLLDKKLAIINKDVYLNNSKDYLFASLQ